MGIAGSLREASYNRPLLLAAGEPNPLHRGDRQKIRRTEDQKSKKTSSLLFF